MHFFRHFVEPYDGVRKIDGTLGVAVSADQLTYLARWEDGTSGRKEQHDPSVSTFEFDWEDRTKDPLYRQIHDSWALWRHARKASVHA